MNTEPQVTVIPESKKIIRIPVTDDTLTSLNSALEELTQVKKRLSDWKPTATFTETRTIFARNSLTGEIHLQWEINVEE